MVNRTVQATIIRLQMSDRGELLNGVVALVAAVPTALEKMSLGSMRPNARIIYEPRRIPISQFAIRLRSHSDERPAK